MCVLYFTDNSIGAEGARVIGEALKTNTTVTQLDLCGAFGLHRVASSLFLEFVFLFVFRKLLIIDRVIQ